MTHEEFDKLVQQVEKGIGTHPDALRKRVAWLAFLGYMSLLASLGVVLCLGLAFIIPGILWPSEAFFLLVIGALILISGTWTVGRTLWVNLDSPEGYPLSRDEAPELYAMLDELRTSLNSIPYAVLLITPEHNASVVQLPRLGVFGWYKNYLLIGLPLMESLSPDEFRAVMAHEFAHLSRRHAQSSQWIYRLRRCWEPIFAKLSHAQAQGEVSIRPLVVKWLDWFWPRFNAHAFVQSRAHEYQADLVAAHLTGLQNATKALARTALQGLALERRFWPELWQTATTHPAPPSDTFFQLAHFLNNLSADEQRQFLEQSLCSITTNTDTHPCLSDRLRPLGWMPGNIVGILLNDTSKPNAAQFLLGAGIEEARSKVHQLWFKRCKKIWQTQHEKSHALNDRMHKLKQITNNKDLDALWDKAQVVAELQNQEAAEPLLHEILAMDASHALANFKLGLLLLKRGKAEGEVHIERALAQNEDWLPQAAGAYHSFFQSTGQSERIRELNARMDRFEQTIKASHKERSSIGEFDTFISHQLSDIELAALRDILAKVPEIDEAHLGRKELHHFTHQRLYILCLQIRPLWHHLPSSSREDEIVARVARSVHLPGRMRVFAPSGSFGPIARKLRRLPGSEVFRR